VNAGPAKIARATAAALAVLVVLWGAFHVMIPWVHPEQVAPEGHPAAACWACHIVSGSAEIVEREAEGR
jgi:hypothetical protein